MAEKRATDNKKNNVRGKQWKEIKENGNMGEIKMHEKDQEKKEVDKRKKESKKDISLRNGNRYFKKLKSSESWNVIY